MNGRTERVYAEIAAKRVLRDWIRPDNGLYNLYCYINWDIGDKDATLDGLFNAEQLEAIAWWMRNKGEKGEE